MLKSIEEWNPQEDYKDYPLGLMYDMDFVAMYLKEKGYEPRTLTMKEYVLNIIEWIGFWNKNTQTNKWCLVCREGDLEKFFSSHKFNEFEIDGRWSLFNRHISE